MNEQVLGEYELPGDASRFLVFAQDIVDPQGEFLPAPEAAERLAARLEDVRNEPKQGKRDLLGVRVAVNLEVQGLLDEPLVLFSRLIPAEGTVIPEIWAQAMPICWFVANTEDDVGTLDVWVPLPEAAGLYQIDLIIAKPNALDVPLTSKRTEFLG
ncbi:hypothetical protein [Geodermatophilus amargosae]|uniref:hypothetical protein n=1 Tax=Geodermatophilus amargosae TaxID=1296565 RepID=UPI0015879C34|nr:hypothetical protein [Geodermatophilus amargosae]